MSQTLLRSDASKIMNTPENRLNVEIEVVNLIESDFDIVFNQSKMTEIIL